MKFRRYHPAFVALGDDEYNGKIVAIGNILSSEDKMFELEDYHGRTEE